MKKCSVGFVFDFKGQSSSDGFVSGALRNFKAEYNSKEKSLFIGISSEKGIDYGQSQSVYEKTLQK